MNISAEQEDLKEALERVGLRRGDNVLIFSDLGKLGLFSNSSSADDLCKKYHEILSSIIGDEGTVIVPTYTTQVGRFGEPFDVEETPSICGIFPEYIRKLDNSVRSRHPIHSCAAIGANSQIICGRNSLSNYGWGSPMSRLHNQGSKVISIGLPAGMCVAIAHYIETMLAVPYVYNKLLDAKVTCGGKAFSEQYFATVRHLDLEYKLEFSAWLEALNDKNLIRGCNIGRGSIFGVKFSDAFNVAEEKMRENPYFLLDKKPNFIKGQIPFDGSTFERENKIPIEKQQPRTSAQDGYRMNTYVVESAIIDQTSKM